jgi:hypothetical protein
MLVLVELDKIKSHVQTSRMVKQVPQQRLVNVKAGEYFASITWLKKSASNLVNDNLSNKEVPFAMSPSAFQYQFTKIPC